MAKKLDIISLNRKAWNNVVEKYIKSKNISFNPLVEYFCDELSENSSVLDLGSGTGLPYAKLFIEKGFNYLGIDLSSRMVEIAQKNVPSAKFKVMSMTEINFDNEFDGVFSSYSMLLLSPELLKDVAKRVVKSLKLGALLYISLNEPRVKNADLEKDVVSEIMGEKMYSRAYTEKEIIEIFSPLGLKIIKIHRKILSSEDFGIEHMMVMVFKKMV